MTTVQINVKGKGAIEAPENLIEQTATFTGYVQLKSQLSEVFKEFYLSDNFAAATEENRIGFVLLNEDLNNVIDEMAKAQINK